jgi:hypothetical protein
MRIMINGPNLTEKMMPEIRTIFDLCVKYINNIQLDFDKFKIKGVSHYYALFGLAYHCVENNVPVEAISKKIVEFYETLRGSSTITGDVQAYKESMQSNTRSKGQRIRRINALITFCAV